MRFVLALYMGNEAMCDADDIRDALHRTAAKLQGTKPEIGDSGVIRDRNGNTVGAWHVDGGE